MPSSSLDNIPSHSQMRTTDGSSFRAIDRALPFRPPACGMRTLSQICFRCRLHGIVASHVPLLAPAAYSSRKALGQLSHSPQCSLDRQSAYATAANQNLCWVRCDPALMSTLCSSVADTQRALFPTCAACCEQVASRCSHVSSSDVGVDAAAHAAVGRHRWRCGASRGSSDAT